MKKLFTLLFLATLLSCNNKENYTITLHLPEVAGETLTLNRRIPGAFEPIDSVTLDSTGTGSMAGAIGSPELVYMIRKSDNMRTTFFLDNSEYQISGSFDAPIIVAEEGAQVQYQAYNAATDNLTDSRRLREFDSTYILENPSSIISLYLIRSGFYEYSLKQLSERLGAIDPGLQDSPYYIYLADHLERMKKVDVGEKYIDFELPDPDSNMVKLSDMIGNGVILIDFWASWCPPCRAANPEVVKIYNEFHEKGFDIIGVSLDKTSEKWIGAIESDSLTWTHVSELDYWNSTAGKLYAVASIPHTVLIGKDGTILANRLEPEALREKLETVLGE